MARKPNDRRSHLASLFGGGEAPVNADDRSAETAPSAATVPAAPQGQSTRSGAVRAMGLSLDATKTGPRDIRDLDPAAIDPAPIADRLGLGVETDDPGFDELRRSIATQGQQVPVLVRPHADATARAGGRFQAAYGHRRIAAARLEGIKVKAIVREMEDAELILAQGQENSGRRDLSFAERAFFARSLMDHGHDRATAQAALGVHPAEMTRLLQLADRMPRRVAQAIGPAPRVGRPRWMALTEHWTARSPEHETLLNELMASDGFTTLDSDVRFARVFALFDAEPPKTVKQPAGLTARRGKKAIARLAMDGTPDRRDLGRNGPSLALAVDLPAGFAEHLTRALPDLLKAFEADRTSGAARQYTKTRKRS